MTDKNLAESSAVALLSCKKVKEEEEEEEEEEGQSLVGVTT